MNAFDTLVSADTVRATPGVRIVDVRFDLVDTGAGERAFAEAHVPGSVYLHLERDLSGPKRDAAGVMRGRHPLPERRAFAEVLGRIGVTPETPVVALDAQGGVYAARLWWMLRWMGHEHAAVLDGGLDAWGGGLTAEVTAPAPVAPYPERPSRVATVDVDTLARSLGTVPIVDARAGERFRGEVEPLDAAAGHIPGAYNRFFKTNLGEDGRFKPAERLRAEFEALLAGRAPGSVVHQCGSGVTACHNLLAMEHAGLAGSVLYPGSWSEWSSDPSRPIAAG